MFASLMSFRLVQGQLSCFTPGGERGQCISVLNCLSLVTIINKKDRTQQDIDFLRKSKCGYVGKTPKVCCPGPQCKTPDGNHGTCVGVHSCPHLAAMVKQSISKEDVQYLQNSICDGPEQYSVCCGPLKEETQVGNCKNRMNALPPDPRTECCGLRSGNKIIRGTEAAIDEYPWLALIEYEKDGVIKALCNGALISGKYVLTPGHCVVGPILNVGTPKNIRLGEYDTVNDGRDSINIEGGGVDCTDPPVVIPIELTILHPQIELNSRKNDIALIRMRQNAPFTDFIQPICLPTVDVTASRSDEDRY